MSVSNPQQWKIDEKQSPAAYRLPSSPPRHPSSPAMSATPVAALIPGEGEVSAPKKMERQGTAMDSDSEKGTIELEAESNWSKEPQLQCRDETERNDEEISNDKYANMGDHSKNRDELIVKLKEDAKATKGIEEIFKDKYAKLRDKFESRERKWSEEVNKDEEKCRCLEVEKMDLEVAARSDDQVVEKLKAAEAEIEALKSLLGYKDGKIAMLVKENERLGKEKMKIKEELQGWVLQMEEAVKRFTGATYASHVGKQAKGNGDLQSSDWKKRLEEDEKMKGEFLQKMGVLEKERGEMEAEVWKLEREISWEKEKVLNNMTAMEAKEKKIMELVQRIEVLEKENRAIEVNHANREKSEIERILKEKMDVEAGKRTVKEEVEEEIFQLVHRIGIFEKEKRDLEEEIRQKDEVIQVLVQENDCLEDKIKKLNTEINKRAVKSKEDAELPQRVHLANNGCILGTPTQNQGQKSAGFPHSDEHKRSLNYGDALNLDVKKEGMMNFATACESKRPLPENLSGGRSSEDTVSFGRFGNSSIAKRSRPSMKNP